MAFCLYFDWMQQQQQQQQRQSPTQIKQSPPSEAKTLQTMVEGRSKGQGDQSRWKGHVLQALIEAGPKAQLSELRKLHSLLKGGGAYNRLWGHKEVTKTRELRFISSFKLCFVSKSFNFGVLQQKCVFVFKIFLNLCSQDVKLPDFGWRGFPRSSFAVCWATALCQGCAWSCRPALGFRDLNVLGPGLFFTNTYSIKYWNMSLRFICIDIYIWSISHNCLILFKHV